MITLTKAYPLRAIHCIEHLEDEPYIHGHNYTLMVEVTGSLNTDSGLIINRDHVDQVVRKSILDKYDKVNLNQHFKWTSGEKLSEEFFMILQQSPLAEDIVSVSLQETRKNGFKTQKRFKNVH